MTDAQYSKHFQRSGKWSYVFLEWIATYINRERKTKINLLLNLLQLTLSHLFKSRIRFRREQYRNPVLNSAIYLWIWHFPNRNKMFLCLIKLLVFFFFFFDKLFHSVVIFRATILRYFCNFASRLVCKPHLGEIQQIWNICVLWLIPFGILVRPIPYLLTNRFTDECEYPWSRFEEIM